MGRLAGVVGAGLGVACLPFTTAAWGAGYKLPETSTNATALSAAYVANAKGPDASYYNPAGMALDQGGAALQGDLTLVHLPSIEFDGTQTIPGIGAIAASDDSETENFLIPTLHYVSPYVGDARFGLSIVAPGGLSKRWDGYAAGTAKEFSLQLIEINPTVGYRINDRLAIGGGARLVYSDGVVKSGSPAPVFRDLNGDSFDLGYNLAVHFEPNESLRLAATYRSKVDLTIKGNAKLGINGLPTLYKGSASVEVPLPAALALSAALDIRDDTTVELVAERTYWSDYKELDFEYGSPVPGPLVPPFDDPIAKDWDDTMTYRFGLTHHLNPQWTLMAGFAIDESPTPEKTVNFELPESDGLIYSVGARYKISEQLELAGAVLYTRREKLKVDATRNDNGLDGRFSGAGAVLVSVGGIYRFD